MTHSCLVHVILSSSSCFAPFGFCALVVLHHAKANFTPFYCKKGTNLKQHYRQEDDVLCLERERVVCGVE